MTTQYVANPVWHESWDSAFDVAVNKAKDWFPPSHASRVDKALEICLEGRIMMLRSGDAIVESDKSTVGESKVYNIVRGHCECPDAEFRGPWCKHNLARGLMIRASQVIQTAA